MDTPLELRTIDRGDLRLLSSRALESLPGLSHAFSAPGPGPGEGTDEQIRAILLALGAPGLAVRRIRQVHGTRVIVVPPPPFDGVPEADAAVCTHAGVALAVQTADCLPVLLCDPVCGAFGAAHAGWRGLLNGAVEQAVRALADECGASPGNIRAVVGPSIGPCCYEVGPEVGEAYRKRHPDWDRIFVPGHSPGREHLDLREGVRQALLAEGIAPGAIAVSDLCTFCRRDLFPSWRRDGPSTGRVVAVIARTGAP